MGSLKRGCYSLERGNDWSIFVETNVMYLCNKKNTNILQKKFKWFLVLMKVEGILNHAISHDVNCVWIPCD